MARLAGLGPYGVICEIMNEDGSMARLADLQTFAKKHSLKMGTVADLIAFLASSRSSYITGQNIRIDGGITRSV